MRTRDRLRELRQLILDAAARSGVREIRVFGSVARGEEADDSDIDFLVEFDRSAPQHPFDAYFGLKEALEELFGRPVDLVEAGAVRNPYLKASIEQTRENIYAA